MPDPALNEPLPDSLLERRAVRAWSRLRPNSVEPPATVEEWVSAFKHKRDEIVTHRCQSAAVVFCN